MAGTISNCENYGKIEGTKNVAGIAAIYATATNCQNYGYIKGENNCGRNWGWPEVAILIVKTMEK